MKKRTPTLQGEGASHRTACPTSRLVEPERVLWKPEWFPGRAAPENRSEEQSSLAEAEAVLLYYRPRVYHPLGSCSVIISIISHTFVPTALAIAGLDLLLATLVCFMFHIEFYRSLAVQRCPAALPRQLLCREW